MPVKAVVKNLDGLSDDVKKLYKEDNGKYVLDVEPTDGLSLEDVGQLKKTLSRERERATELEGKLKKFGDVDPESVERALALQKELDGKPLDKAVEERIKIREQQLTEKYSKEIKSRDEKIHSLNSSLENELIVGSATQAIAAKKGNVKLLLPHVRQSLRIREVDGRYITQVVEADGKTPRLSPKSGSNEPMTVSELIEEFSKSEDFQSAFEGSDGGGSGGTKGGKGTPSRPGTVNLSDWDAVGSSLEDIAKGKVLVNR